MRKKRLSLEVVVRHPSHSRIIASEITMTIIPEYLHIKLVREQIKILERPLEKKFKLFEDWGEEENPPINDDELENACDIDEQRTWGCPELLG